MPNALIYILLFALFSCFSCQQDTEKTALISPLEENASLSVVENKQKINNGLKRGDLLRVEVQNLRLREHEQLEAKVLRHLPEGSELYFMGDISSDSVTVQLRGKKYYAPFYRVKTELGYLGWVHAAAVKKQASDLKGS
ncbi:hypothetical protein [Saprospira grandis]|uniref:hypothetical protein n=1 Tax=Saprospira grandis TaxID=1008 RepID=UPI0022DDD480|nr:hypothetical protein [Saprospira grandis]WBM75313.1 hypothetical protein OP864_03510 [Saprospira grandis]